MLYFNISVSLNQDVLNKGHSYFTGHPEGDLGSSYIL
jgi:hypothetical protein